MGERRTATEGPPKQLGCVLRGPLPGRGVRSGSQRAPPIRDAGRWAEGVRPTDDNTTRATNFSLTVEVGKVVGADG